MRWDEGDARRLAAGRRGLLDRDDVVTSGGADDSVQRRLAVGTWTRIHAGVYYLNVTDPTWLTRVQAALLAAGPHARASHRTAGRVWGIDGLRSRVIELTVPYSKRPVPAGVTVHRTRRALPGEVVEGVAVTTIERTLLDLASLLPGPALEKAVSSAVRLRLTTPSVLGDRIVEQGGRGVRGTRNLRRAIADVDQDRTGSSAEVELKRLIEASDIPQPESQHRIPLPGGSNAYPDFAWPGRRKIVEVDGFEAHGTPRAMESDLIRQNALLEAGWQIRRYSAALIRRDPGAVIADIVRFIGDP